ncbi:MAG: acetylxylan esterase, partial [Tunicatimonas sp.]
MISILVISSYSFAQESNYSVFAPYYRSDAAWMKYANLSHSLYNHISQLAKEDLDSRSKVVKELTSAEDWTQYVERQKNQLRAPFNKFEKHSLNAQSCGTIEREEYIVEKLVFESHPSFYVTASLFIPTQRAFPLPAVFYVTGHSQAAFRRDIYQINILNLVKKGFVVFTIDPIGQGERTQYYDSTTHESTLGKTTHEHSYAGGQCFLTGYSINDYFVWDGIRSLDYLSQRPEVDPTRIGMTGLSGGGQQTAVLAAIDDRVYAAAPECYITSYQRLFESIGSQDAEQKIYQVLHLGLDHPDFLAVRAPKPTLLIATTEDFFSIQGARETFSEVKQLYRLFDQPQHLTMVESPGSHGTTRPNREAMYQFFQQHLNLPGSSTDIEPEYLSTEELQITPTGQVTTSYQSKTVFDLNRQRSSDIVAQRTSKNAQDVIEQKSAVLDQAYSLSGLDTTRTFRGAVFTGSVEKESYRVEKYFLESDDFDYPLPFVIIKSTNSQPKATLLYVGAHGKQELLEHESHMIDYLQEGYAIVAPDLLGTGELKNAERGDAFIQGYSYNLWVGANLVGRSIAGFQASDLDVLLKYLPTHVDLPTDTIVAVVKDEAISSYLHIAPFYNENIRKTILINPLMSYQSINDTQYYDPKYLWTSVPGAIQHYDLAHLMAYLAPSDLYLVNPVDASGNTWEASAENTDWKMLLEVFESQK